MDQLEFESLLIRVTSIDSFIAESAAEKINKIAVSTEIRDFEWTSILYDSLWTGLTMSWQQASSVIVDPQSKPAILKIDKLLWNIFKVLLQFPEFNLKAAVTSPNLTEQSVHALLNRALTSNSLIWQQCLHWIYSNSTVLRPMIRLSLCASLLKKGSTAVPASIVKVRHTDGGKSRDHIALLLEVLICIIEGFTCLKTNHKDMMMHILMPLHSPNEMVEWRDQIPVLQLYHQPLVRCLTACLAKDFENKECDVTILKNGKDVTMATISENDSSIENNDHLPKKIKSRDLKQKSLLYTILKSLMTYWPPSYAANTPKEGVIYFQLMRNDLVVSE